MKLMDRAANSQPKTNPLNIAPAVVFVAALMVPELFAAPAEFGDTNGGLLDSFNVNSLLTMASIVVVAIAVVFAVFEIVFRRRRIRNVTPIVIGALLIGAACHIARDLL